MTRTGIVYFEHINGQYMITCGKKEQKIGNWNLPKDRIVKKKNQKTVFYT